MRQWKFITGTELPVAKDIAMTEGNYSPWYGVHSSLLEALSGPIDKLRRQRKADCKPKKPKPVTDEQLLAIVDELQAEIKRLDKKLDTAIEGGTEGRRVLSREIGAVVEETDAKIKRLKQYVNDNFKLRFFAPTKRDITSDFFEF